MIFEVRVLVVESVNRGGQWHHLLDGRYWLDGLHQE